MEARFLLMLMIGATALFGRTQQLADAPFRIGIVGLVHDHAQGFLGELGSRRDIELVGIAEANPELVARYATQYKLPTAIFYPTVEKMLDATKVRAVAVCSSTFDHKRIVEVCAARGVNVMVEKPLAVSLEHAHAIASAAARGGIQVVVNYETTWYPVTQTAGVRVNEEHVLGDLRKIIVRDGHQGPREIGASKEFLAWLTDPVLDGGGALMDFGCYGADLITWLMRGERPVSVTAVTQQIKPEIYPKVEDEATIILTYPHTQGIIQASWNWPFGRKDFELYGTRGSLLAPERNTLRLRTSDGPVREETLPALEGARRDPLDFFAGVVRGEIKPDGLSSLQTNLIVTEILDAARASARTGHRIDLAK